MNDKIKSLFRSLHTWQIFLFSIVGAVVITDLATVLLSLWFWHRIKIELLVLGTINATLVPLIILPVILRGLRQVVKLEEQNRLHLETITQLETQYQIEAAIQRRADEMSLLYHLGISLTSGKNLYDTLLALQTEILKLIQVDTFYVAIYDASTDIVTYPIFFEDGKPFQETGRLLHEWPGLTGAVVFSGKTLYLSDMYHPEVVDQYRPHNTHGLELHTFLGIPLIVDGNVLGMLSVQSYSIAAYTSDQIQLMENVAIQAAIAINKANLMDQLNQELLERKNVEAQMHEREAILEATTFAAEQFLKSADWRTNMDMVLARLGQSLKATHAYLFEDHFTAQGEFVTSMRYEWTAPGYPSDLDKGYFQNAPIHKAGYEDQVAALLRGDVRVGNSSTFNPIEKENMDEFGVKSILEVPITVNEKIWGAIGFDDFEQERNWSNGEVDALKIAAGVLSAAIQREKAESAVRESERIYRQAIEAAGAVPYYRDYQKDAYQFMGKGIQKISGYAPEEVTVSLWNRITQERELVGDLAGMDMSETVRRARSGELDHWRCDVRILTPDGESKWVADSAIQLFDDTHTSFASVGILQDITDRKLIEAGLRKREAILEAITFSAEQFLKAADWRERIDTVLERLGREFNASHAYLFEKHPNPEGVILSSMTYEWTAPGCETDLGDARFTDMPPAPMGIDRLYDTLDRGEPLVASTSYFSAQERKYMDSIHVKAMLEMRVSVDGVHWGTLGFDEVIREREWTTIEVDVLRVAANVLGAAIKRQMDEAALQRELDERRRAEQALKFSEQKFSKAFHTTQVLMTIESDKNLFIDINQAFIDGFGYSRNEVIGHNASDLNIFYDPADGPRLRQMIREKGSLKDFEIRYRRKSGESGYILLSSESFSVDDVEYTLTSGLDITNRKRAEENYRSIFNNSIDGIFQSTETGRFITVNPAMARIYGYDSPEDMLQSVNDISIQLYVDANQRQELRQRLSSGERLIGFEALEYRKDWSTFWSLTTMQAVRDDNGAVLYYEGTVEDITPRKQAEMERERLIADLESKNTELERFAYTVSHDLKSPLVTINGFLGYLEQDAASGNLERLKKDTQRIYEAVNKMQRLLNELLELSRIGRMMNPPEEVSFNDLVYEALEVVQGRLNERNVTVHIQSDMSVVAVDKPRLIEVLQNLLDNAAKYMGEQPNPLIEIGERAEAVGHSLFYIRDNGMGVAAEYHERIFGLFNKLDPRSEGTGVGLALVKRIIEIHGGRIWVESEVGQGSTFFFTLPV